MPRPAFINVTDPPYCADPTGVRNCTKAFQWALDAAGAYQDRAFSQQKVCGDDRVFAYGPNWEEKPNAESNIVFVPSGIYKIDGPIFIPPNVTLEGTWVSPPDCDSTRFPSPNQVGAQSNWQWWRPEVYRPLLHGTAIVTDYGRGYEDRTDKYAFITLLGPNSILKGIWIYYRLQGVKDEHRADELDKMDTDPTKYPYQYPDLFKTAFDVAPYQWTIRAGLDGSSYIGGCTVSDVLLHNSYRGLDFSTDGGRHILQHIWGQVIREGIRIDRCGDIGRILDIHFYPIWDREADRERDGAWTFLRDFTAQFGFALVMYGTDWEIVHDFFALGFYVGVHLGYKENFKHDGTVESYRVSSGQFSNLNLDSSTNGIDFHAVGKNGIQVTNADIVCKKLFYVLRDEPNRKVIVNYLPALPRHAIVGHNHSNLVPPLPGGFLAVRGGSFFGTAQGSMVSWQSNQSMLMISSSWFQNELPLGLVPDPIIDIGAGRAIIQGNWFPGGAGSDAVRVAPGVPAVVTGNMSVGHAFPLPLVPKLIVNDNISLPI
jgi:hypothetical protein